MSFRPLRKQNGQIAIFLVLVFQVLFIFFAMSINVGLVVYDKVNLQNATDIAAYYAAQKQAEMLNQIGHVNYQIRQAYKLLTFRIRVIGSISIGFGADVGGIPYHPILTSANPTFETNNFTQKLGTALLAPGVCVGSTLWHEYKVAAGSDTSSWCRQLETVSMVPPVSGGSDPLGLIGGLNGFLNAIIQQGKEKCKTINVLNWQMASSFLLGYMLEAKKRSEMIDNIAKRASLPGAEMADFNGASVFTGTFNTLKKNLTDPQRATASMELINSLSEDAGGGSCSDPNFWLPKVEIFPIVTFVRLVWNDAALGCSESVVTNRVSGGVIPPAADIAAVGGRNANLMSDAWASGNPISMGVEKNPWCMPYMGVKATTSPRKIFSPFGSPVVLKAEAFAKPFGGRIGPWYNTQWPSGSATSQGIGRTDPLLPARSISGNRTPGDTADDLVNFSKYPGDQHGLNSQYALAVMSDFFKTKMLMGAPLSNPPAVFALAHYNHVGDPTVWESEPDSFARPNGSPINAERVRQLEETAVAPDLFDLTYYSIDAQYSHNYFHPNLENFQSSIADFYLDLGSQGRQPYSVFHQINKSNDTFGGASPFYMVDDPNQLLTGWTQNRAVDYSFPDKFGKCDLRRDADIEAAPSPGGCAHGGRTGYSVKVVSKTYLKKINAPLGGAGNEGPILNPPE